MRKTLGTKPWGIAQLKYLQSEKKLWLNPSYQRNAVWTGSQKQLFVDSLLREFDIPKLYFREVSKQGYEYEVVDGQQRLLAIFDFLADAFKMPKDSDPVDGHSIAGRTFSKLETPLQMKLLATSLDVVTFVASSTDEEIEETFLRLQNGTPLNAAEKRRAIQGDMRDRVAELATHKVFDLCGFSDKRYAYEDVVAKSLHLLFAGTITDIRPVSIAKTYENHTSLNPNDPTINRLKTTYNFLKKAFGRTGHPALKKYALITLGYLTAELLDTYDLSQYPSEFANAYRDFDAERVKNEELPEEQQNPQLAAYTDAARADSIQDLRFRHEFLRERLVAALPNLSIKDRRRTFSEEQRRAIYWRDKGKCCDCGCDCDEYDFHADHVQAHSQGGPTSIANGQLLCPPCNLKKGSRPARQSG